MTTVNPVERLVKSSPQLKIWWDSSPLVCEEWLAGMPPTYPGADFFLPVITSEGKTRYSAESLLHGATTNQQLTWQVIERDPDLSSS